MLMKLSKHTVDCWKGSENVCYNQNGTEKYMYLETEEASWRFGEHIYLIAVDQ